MLRVVIETGVFLCFIHWANWDVLLVSTQEWWNTGTVETCSEETVRR